MDTVKLRGTKRVEAGQASPTLRGWRAEEVREEPFYQSRPVKLLVAMILLAFVIVELASHPSAIVEAEEEIEHAIDSGTDGQEMSLTDRELQLYELEHQKRLEAAKEEAAKVQHDKEAQEESKRLALEREKELELERIRLMDELKRRAEESKRQREEKSSHGDSIAQLEAARQQSEKEQRLKNIESVIQTDKQRQQWLQQHKEDKTKQPHKDEIKSAAYYEELRKREQERARLQEELEQLEQEKRESTTEKMGIVHTEVSEEQLAKAEKLRLEAEKLLWKHEQDRKAEWEKTHREREAKRSELRAKIRSVDNQTAAELMKDMRALDEKKIEKLSTSKKETSEFTDEFGLMPPPVQFKDPGKQIQWWKEREAWWGRLRRGELECPSFSKVAIGMEEEQKFWKFQIHSKHVGTYIYNALKWAGLDEVPEGEYYDEGKGMVNGEWAWDVRWFSWGWGKAFHTVKQIMLQAGETPPDAEYQHLSNLCPGFAQMGRWDTVDMCVLARRLNFTAHPRCFVIPDELDDARNAMQESGGYWYRSGRKMPGHGTEVVNLYFGTGNRLEKPEELPQKEMFVTEDGKPDSRLYVLKEYLPEPLVLTKYGHFQFRVFMVVTSMNPVIAYMSQNGVMKYIRPQFRNNTETDQDQTQSVGDIFSLDELLDHIIEDCSSVNSTATGCVYIKGKSKDVFALKTTFYKQLEKLLTRLLLSEQKPFLEEYDNYHMPFWGRCFTFQGIDMTIDQHFRPILLRFSKFPFLGYPGDRVSGDSSDPIMQAEWKKQIQYDHMYDEIFRDLFALLGVKGFQRPDYRESLEALLNMFCFIPDQQTHCPTKWCSGIDSEIVQKFEDEYHHRGQFRRVVPHEYDHENHQFELDYKQVQSKTDTTLDEWLKLRKLVHFGKDVSKSGKKPSV